MRSSTSPVAALCGQDRLAAVSRAQWRRRRPLLGHDPPRRPRSSFPWPQLLDAPVLVIPWVEPGAYVRRYSEADKVRTGLGEGPDAWSVPYWWVDGGAAAMTILFAAADAGLGALLFGLFEHEDDVRSEFGVPDGFRDRNHLARPSRSGSPIDVRRPEAAIVRHGRAPRGLVITPPAGTTVGRSRPTE